MIGYIDMFGVELIFRTLAATEGGFITPAATRPRRPSLRVALSCVTRSCPVVERVHAEDYGVYGARKIWQAMLREGWQIGRDQVARLMRKAGLEGVVRGRKPRITIPSREPDLRPDLVERRFRADRPNRL
jgi:putative transposase